MMWYVGIVNDEDTSMKGGKMSIRLEVWGENALFSRSEFKTERVTYDVSYGRNPAIPSVSNMGIGT